MHLVLLFCLHSCLHSLPYYQLLQVLLLLLRLHQVLPKHRHLHRQVRILKLLLLLNASSVIRSFNRRSISSDIWQFILKRLSSSSAKIVTSRSEGKIICRVIGDCIQEKCRMLASCAIRDFDIKVVFQTTSRLIRKVTSEVLFVLKLLYIIQEEAARLGQKDFKCLCIF
jgi:hypothetical protein